MYVYSLCVCMYSIGPFNFFSPKMVKCTNAVFLGYVVFLALKLFQRSLKNYKKKVVLLLKVDGQVLDRCTRTPP